MKEIVDKALQVLRQGGLLLYPTDTVWGIGCDATNAAAVARIYQLKQREESKAMICLVSDDRMLERYVQQVPDAAYDLITHSDRPTTIVYDEAIGLAENLVAADRTIAIRVVQSGFAHELIKKFRKPIVSTSANISGTSTPRNRAEISKAILEGVDYVVPLPDTTSPGKPSLIIQLKNTGEVKILRN
jgi:L-threonylcarbamoyladenylate synthase